MATEAGESSDLMQYSAKIPPIWRNTASTMKLGNSPGWSNAVKTLTLFNHKGGVGKTTLTVNLSDALADLGFRVLMIDADPQCNRTSFFNDVRETDTWRENLEREIASLKAELGRER